MTELSGQMCEPCRTGAPKVTDSECERYLAELVGWVVQEENGLWQLVKVYNFSNFAEALAFTNRVGEVAETADHHPTLLTEWGKVTVRWWTHKIRGLHRNDFIMAAKTDELIVKTVT